MKIHSKCNYKTEESMNYCPRCGSMMNETFQSDFYMRNTILNQIQLGILFLEEIWSYFFVKFFSMFLCTLFMGFTFSQQGI